VPPGLDRRRAYFADPPRPSPYRDGERTAGRAGEQWACVDFTQQQGYWCRAKAL